MQTRELLDKPGREALGPWWGWHEQIALQEAEALMQRVVQGGGADTVLAPMVLQHLATGGKRLRARLALAAAHCLGGARSAAVAWAAACELAHNATLVHDDLQDGDRVRRGQPTTWVCHGMVQAINAGDLLFMAPLLAIDATGLTGEARAQLSALLAERMLQVIRGQAFEFALTQGLITNRPSYDQAITGKTSALFELPVEGAALVAGRSRSVARALAAAFGPLGALFQMQDDVLDLFGDKGREKPGADLREGKVSALVVEHLALHPEERAWLAALLRTPRDETSDTAVAEAIERFRAGGALAAVLARMQAAAAEVERAPALLREPGLLELARELVALVLKPIAHVW